MSIKIYNTLHNAKEEFVPVEEGKVKMYVWYPTTYNYIHLGNARPIVAFDVIRRYFAYRGYDVTYVQNFTDVDDKIINRANEEKMHPKSWRRNILKLTSRMLIDWVSNGQTSIPVSPSTCRTSLTWYRPLWITVSLMKSMGMSISKCENLPLTASFPVVLLMRCRQEPELLWASRNGILWTSPYGKPQNPENLLGIVLGGRAPGWHIECSAMSTKISWQNL